MLVLSSNNDNSMGIMANGFTHLASSMLPSHVVASCTHILCMCVYVAYVNRVSKRISIMVAKTGDFSLSCRWQFKCVPVYA